MNVNLRKSELDLLINSIGEKRPDLVLAIEEALGDYCLALKIPDKEADEMREIVSDDLQFRGFDTNYELTTEGRVLQDLIDKLFTG